MKRCPICSSMNIKRYSYISICQECGFYLSDSHSTDAIVAHYNSYTFEKHKTIAKSQQKIYEIIIDRIKRHFQNLNNLKVLEIGFGHGYLLKKLSDEGLECYGIDISVSSLKNALEIGVKKDKLFLGDFIEFGFNLKFNVIIINGVLEEFSKPLAVFDKIKSITLPNAMIILRTKNASFHRFAYRYLNFLFPLVKSIGVLSSCGFSYKSLKILLSKYGFIIKDVSFNLTEGDPYQQTCFPFFIGFLKKVYQIISTLLFKISFGRVVISPSFIVFAIRENEDC